MIAEVKKKQDKNVKKIIEYSILSHFLNFSQENLKLTSFFIFLIYF